MSDASPKRTSADIARQLNNLLARAGATQFNIRAQEKDLEKLNDEIRDLNMEHVATQNAEAKEAEAKAAEAQNHDNKEVTQ